ncbi:MAG: DUF418 domain-containing protein [Marinibacterium sp.]|nr:DUF418 domain-containing protein [Marinibacterium sp.]
MTQTPRKPRLDGLDLARFLAFVGMVIVNFKIVMGADGGDGLAAALTGAMEGRAAATFVVLAGIGLALAAPYGGSQTQAVTLRRALFLLVIGLANMTVFDADILHYYAFYFAFGALLLPLSTGRLWVVILGLTLGFVVLLFALDYDAGWDWDSYSYQGFWTLPGFIRNLFFNGWHPVIPWLAFLLFGIVLGRADLSGAPTQRRLIAGGIVACLLAEGLSVALRHSPLAADPELADLLGTGPVPPMPLYMLAGCGVASALVGLCLTVAPALKRVGVLAIVTPAGRQTLTLYVAHILIGMGVLEALGLDGGQTAAAALRAALIFCGLAVVYAWLWARLFKRGPVEALMRATAG